ncbi:hypothetical protein Asi03nite_45140 [Actinoplanes siamensis]|uniref:Uncharacterized protein n=1 Tax=Actinoplanes siamensis TaxID=1223317 RepID=A0A919N9V8_9ACTN|nr:hypothetical protein Asi03nite_45140 [Actinoplanes siamensis]
MRWSAALSVAAARPGSRRDPPTRLSTGRNQSVTGQERVLGEAGRGEPLGEGSQRVGLYRLRAAPRDAPGGEVERGDVVGGGPGGQQPVGGCEPLRTPRAEGGWGSWRRFDISPSFRITLDLHVRPHSAPPDPTLKGWSSVQQLNAAS